MKRAIMKNVLRRELFLFLAGAGWITYGSSLITQEPTDLRGLQLVLHVAPLHCWAWVWIAAGLVAVTGSLRRRHHRIWDDAGFIAAAVLPVIWSASYIVSWPVEGNAPRGCTWLLMAGAILSAAGGIETREAR